MRLATFLTPEGPAPHHGEVRGDRIVAFDTGSVIDRLASGDLTPADGQDYALDEVSLLAPVQRPRAIFGIGLNYAAHAAETGKDLPEQPMVFMKLPTLERLAQRHRPRPGRRRQAPRLRGRARGRARRRQPHRRLRGRQRPLRPRPPGPRAAVDARQGLRLLLPLGPLDHDRRRGRRPRGAAPQLTGQRRGAPGLEHLRPRLRPAGAGGLDRPDLHARARRHHPHRHARRASASRWTRRSSSRRATSCGSRSRPRRDRAHDRDRGVERRTSTALGREAGGGAHAFRSTAAGVARGFRRTSRSPEHFVSTRAAIWLRDSSSEMPRGR